MNQLIDYGAKECTASVLGQRETLRERLQRRREQASDHLKNIEKAIAFLDNNKGFEEFHDLVGKVGG